MAIFAADFGKNFGWALRTGAQLESGRYNLSDGRKHESIGAQWLRLQAFLFSVQDGCKKDGDPISHVVFEYNQFKGDRNGVYAALANGGYIAIVSAWAERIGATCYTPTVQQIRKGAFGKGNLKKEQVAFKIRELGYSPKTLDESDAIAALLYFEKVEVPKCQEFSQSQPPESQ